MPNKGNECANRCHMCKGCAMYGLGFIGAAVYFISQSTGFWTGVLGIIKALFWPGFIIYGLFKYLGL